LKVKPSGVFNPSGPAQRRAPITNYQPSNARPGPDDASAQLWLPMHPRLRLKPACSAMLHRLETGYAGVLSSHSKWRRWIVPSYKPEPIALEQENSGVETRPDLHFKPKAIETKSVSCGQYIPWNGRQGRVAKANPRTKVLWQNDFGVPEILSMVLFCTWQTARLPSERRCHIFLPGRNRFAEIVYPFGSPSRIPCRGKSISNPYPLFGYSVCSGKPPTY
jgi:hypothetical protein